MKNEIIIDYLRREENLARKLLFAAFLMKYSIIKSMRESIQRDRVTFECIKDQNFSLTKMKRVVTTTYQVIEQIESFDSSKLTIKFSKLTKSSLMNDD